MILPTCLGRLLFAFALLHATWAVPLALSAQDAADRAALERLRDSLAGVTDSTALRRLEAATVEVAKRHRDDPLIHLRLGFIAYRSGELAGSKAHYDDAAGEFEWAGELKPDWPYAWYGLGLAELAQGEHAIIAIENLRQQPGKDYLPAAAPGGGGCLLRRRAGGDVGRGVRSVPHGAELPGDRGGARLVRLARGTGGPRGVARAFLDPT